jgi:hypothetical protein
MIYLVTYNEDRDGNAKRLIFVESQMSFNMHRVTGLIDMLTEGNFNAASVEIAGQRDLDSRRIRHPSIRLYKLD